MDISAGAKMQFSATVNQTVSGSIGGGGSIIKDTSSNTLILSGPNSFSGGVTLKQGTLRAGSVNGFGTGAVTCDPSCTPATCTINKGGFAVPNTIVNPGNCTITP
jgi:autotransporter-associated beta strand protein